MNTKKHSNPSKNNVIIFYEKQNKPEPTKAIIDLLPFLKSHGINTHCFDDSNDRNKQEFVDGLTSEANIHKKLGLNAKSLTDPYVKYMINSGAVLINHNATPSKNDEKYIIKGVHDLAKGVIQTLNLAIDLIDHMDKNDIDFCNINLPLSDIKKLEYRLITANEKLDIRNEYRTNKIIEKLAKGDVSILIGADNFGIATKLREKDVKVREYFINYDNTYPSLSKSDYCLMEGQKIAIERPEEFNKTCRGHHLDGLIVRDKSLNASEVIIGDLMNSIYSAHQNDESLNASEVIIGDLMNSIDSDHQNDESLNASEVIIGDPMNSIDPAHHNAAIDLSPNFTVVIMGKHQINYSNHSNDHHEL